MKIAITGHSAGIGQALAKVYSNYGHEIVGLSRRNGYNIRSLPKVADQIEPCDLFINNAQVGYAQTELLFEMYKRWKGIKGKQIILISSMMTCLPVSPLPGIDMTEYRTQKIALEEAFRQLNNYQDWPKLCLVKPGAVATSPEKQTPQPYADVDEWAQTLYNIFETVKPNLDIYEISLSPTAHNG